MCFYSLVQNTHAHTHKEEFSTTIACPQWEHREISQFQLEKSCFTQRGGRGRGVVLGQDTMSSNRKLLPSEGRAYVYLKVKRWKHQLHPGGTLWVDVVDVLPGGGLPSGRCPLVFCSSSPEVGAESVMLFWTSGARPACWGLRVAPSCGRPVKTSPVFIKIQI